MPNIDKSQIFDVAIIGAGISGSAIARELSRYQLKVALIEKENDVASGTTKANSGIVHGGYADKPGSLHAKFSVAGNKMYDKLNQELKFGFDKIGSLVVAFNEEEKLVLKKLYEQGQKNGVRDLALVGPDFVRGKEPNLSRDIVAALYCGSAGVTSPYEFAIALAENAVTNGAEIFLNSAIEKIKKEQDFFKLTTSSGEFLANYVVNAGGLWADRVANMLSSCGFAIKPRQGQYLLFDKDQGELLNTVVFQTPTPISKGILVTPTYHGNLLIGPDANEISDKDELETDRDHIQHIVEIAKKSMPNFDLRKSIGTFAGNRAVPSGDNDFIVAKHQADERFINVAGIASPGLTAAPAIAEYVAELLKDSGLNLEAKKDFIAKREPYKAVSKMSDKDLKKVTKKDPRYGRIICRCEKVSEGEIVDALHRNIPINSLDALKRRVRAGMGRCQGSFCTPRLLDIIHRELGLSFDEITKKGKGSELIKN